MGNIENIKTEKNNRKKEKNNKKIENNPEINKTKKSKKRIFSNKYIPLRYSIAVIFTLLVLIMIIGIVIYGVIYLPYAWTFVVFIEVITIIAIIGKNANPDYKIPWLLIIIIFPVVGVSLYYIFHRQNISRSQIKKLRKVQSKYTFDDEVNFNNLKEESLEVYNRANLIRNISTAHLYTNTKVKYFESGEKAYPEMLKYLKNAKKFIFIYYFIIQKGVFWNSILDILEQKVKEGVEVYCLYDDIGCMMTLPPFYFETLRKKGINAVTFSILKVQMNSEFNNRSHRKMLIVDGKYAFTGGINLADEYINEIERFGYWKDSAIFLEGMAVNELTKTFIEDYSKNAKMIMDENKYLINEEVEGNCNYIMPYSDGPAPFFKYKISKKIILDLLNEAKEYVYITTPYLIVDNELLSSIQNAGMRGVDVKIILPHIPDKKIVFQMTKASYNSLLEANVLLYEFTPGFIHAKTYISDDKYGVLGTVNLDYRSLVHHFENGVWIYDENVVKTIKNDFINTLNQSQKVEKKKENIFVVLFRSILKLIAPLL